MIHLFLDNARYHHAKLVQAWLARPECRIKLHFIPAYCPHLDSIERLWGLMHKHVTHNRCHETFADFSAAALTFLREEVPRKWHIYCDEEPVAKSPLASADRRGHLRKAQRDASGREESRLRRPSSSFLRCAS
jgi:hypothetical protein